MLDKRDEGTLLSILTAKCPNLKNLSIIMTPEDVSFQEMIKHVAVRQDLGCFKRLETVYLGSGLSIGVSLTA